MSVWFMARHLLLKGIRKRTGDGCNTCVWTDLWLPCHPNFKLITNPTGQDMNQRISPLINHDWKVWDENKIRNQFLAVDVDGIRSMPLRNLESFDLLVGHI
ncbi:hypothetical protein CDL12_25794 [Handroanthus impetiginosus]|uniref:Reverse transcriptase zinc-binding domain-containing protein n=1 Tax=Handroanthus impetiginosus TaxID=429701 RepID=A0A2G9G8U5_9LAMI|nr:hypothetical protein CDL12_25794 [Handroanthus impetiginosus]